jgi:hypothetical protein
MKKHRASAGCRPAPSYPAWIFLAHSKAVTIVCRSRLPGAECFLSPSAWLLDLTTPLPRTLTAARLCAAVELPGHPQAGVGELRPAERARRPQGAVCKGHAPQRARPIAGESLHGKGV